MLIGLNFNNLDLYTNILQYPSYNSFNSSETACSLYYLLTESDSLKYLSIKL